MSGSSSSMKPLLNSFIPRACSLAIEVIFQCEPTRETKLSHGSKNNVWIFSTRIHSDHDETYSPNNMYKSGLRKDLVANRLKVRRARNHLRMIFPSKCVTETLHVGMRLSGDFQSIDLLNNGTSTALDFLIRTHTTLDIYISIYIYNISFYKISS